MHTYSFVKRNPTAQGADERVNERARCARFPTRIVARLDGMQPRRLTVIDVSRSGLLATVERGPLPPLRYAVQITVATVRDLQLTLMAVVARHTTVNGQRAMGLKLFPLDEARDALWHAVVEEASSERPLGELVAAFKDEDPLEQIEVEDLVDLGVALELDPADDDEDLLFIDEPPH